MIKTKKNKIKTWNIVLRNINYVSTLLSERKRETGILSFHKRIF